MIAPHPFFEWLAATGVSHALNGSNYVYFGLVMAVHLIGIALLGGVALVVALRVLDWRLPTIPAVRVVKCCARGSGPGWAWRWPRAAGCWSPIR
ncbi:hypothetical protein H1235_15420 [Pseudoxanthomonas sp. NC8]|nr:hypothetical protein H1235_15420 [Pseudoxanthomonas sp. NC8]